MHDNIVNLLTDILQVLQPEKHQPIINRIHQAIQQMQEEGTHVKQSDSHLSQQTQSSQVSNVGVQNNQLQQQVVSTGEQPQSQPEHQPSPAPIFLNVMASTKCIQLFHHSSVVKDFFILDYNRVLKKYIAIGGGGGDATERKVYGELLTGGGGGSNPNSNSDQSNSNSNHYRLKRTNSMTAILKYTSNPPKIMKPLILPIYHLAHDKYIFAFQTKQLSLYHQQYIVSDRLYCFITDKFIPSHLISLIKRMIKKKFQLQLLLKQQTGGDVQYEQSNHHLTHVVYEQLTDMILQLEKELSQEQEGDKQGKREEMAWNNYTIPLYEYEVSVRLNLLYDKSINIGVLLFFFSIKNYKIILLSTKENRYLQSIMIASLIHSLRPLKYISPIITTTLTNQHFEFIHSPVPMILGFWGSGTSAVSPLSTIKQMIIAQNNSNSSSNSQNILRTALIDVNNHKAFYNSLNSQDLTLLQKLTEYVSSFDNVHIPNTLSTFLKDKILTQNRQNTTPWIQYFKQEIRKCQMFQCYIQGK